MNAIKIIHTLKGKAGIDDAAYRALLARCGGVTTSKDLDDASARQVCALLRGMAHDRGGGTSRAKDTRSAAERKIWSLWYQLYPYLAPCERCTAYLVGMIGKTTGGEDIPGLIDGKKIDFNKLGPRHSWKVVEALKQRIRYGQNLCGDLPQNDDNGGENDDVAID